MVASCKASKEAATEPAGATDAAAWRRVALGQARLYEMEGTTKAVVVINVQQATRENALDLLAIVTGLCMVLSVLWLEGCVLWRVRVGG